jgi:tRNA-2-methylthio-N6-dimethylallyladenosine synthase
MVLGLLAQAGYARTEDPSDADVILINTCAVRERAVERVRGRFSGRLLRRNRRPIASVLA